MTETESLAAIANRVIPFPLAASWADVGYGDAGERGGAKTWCPFGALHYDQGREKAFRVYADHGYCFAERKYFTVAGFLAAVWEVTREEAAKLALDKAGYVPADYAHMWEEAQRPQDPGREFLGKALQEWCAAAIPDWPTRQYDPAVSAKLADCLALLPHVNTAGDCELWLEGTKKAMGMFAAL